MSQSEHPIYAATERLLGAIERLEKGLGNLSAGKGRSDKALAKENDALREERANLDAAVLHMQQQYDDLHRVAGTVYNKLEDSIKRLTTIIEE